MQLIVLAGEGHTHAAKVGGQVIQACARVSGGKQPLAPPGNEILHRTRSRRFAQLEFAFADAHHGALDIEPGALRFAIELRAKQALEGLCRALAVGYRELHTVGSVQHGVSSPSDSDLAPGCSWHSVELAHA
jgi:hypothetical protein